ncbi:MAG TPA: HD domain-containing phosphohydrolase [Candidatus Sulfotelmatobacter sp.]|nr:HD domain-containing phosphohydrolase [Candidatus Sulfotelmatobacter sp.]
MSARLGLLSRDCGPLDLTDLDQPRPPVTFGDQLLGILCALKRRERLHDIVRVSVASYDAPTDMLKTFASTDGRSSPLQHYQAPLSRLPSLQAAAADRHFRNLPDLSAPDVVPTAHTKQLLDAGIRSSLAVPIHAKGKLIGFVFFDAALPHLFGKIVYDQLWPYVHLVAMMLVNDLELTRIVRAAVETTQALARYKDPETSSHLQRMSRFARIIATALAPRLKLTDEFIEHLFWFAPLHDIGKVGVPDSILLKPGSLTTVEFEQMKRHVDYGVEIVDLLTDRFELAGQPHVRLMRNVIACHHENVDGSGYPAGLTRDQIPIEGRIVAVADVFDALTSERPYKRRWTNHQALEFIRNHQGTRFDEGCVVALIEHMPEIGEVQDQFTDVFQV